LYTLTLTDIATGWTECISLLHRSLEAVLAAFKRARTLFPYPILGLDTDNGGAFINEELVAYCEQEHLTFTQGRPHQKRDQYNALAEKWGYCSRLWSAMISSLENTQAWQLTELYRALRRSRELFSALDEAAIETTRREKKIASSMIRRRSSATSPSLRGIACPKAARVDPGDLDP
jgi:hypothetical protein